MKPLTVCISTAILAVALPALALQSSLKPVKLAVYENPITFFDEKSQAIDLGPLPAGIKNLSAEACLQCHRQEHAQWKASAHARSVTEPVFAAAFKSEPRFLCRSCHSPLLEQHPVLNPVAAGGAQIREPVPAPQAAAPQAARPQSATPPPPSAPSAPSGGPGPQQEAPVQRQQAVAPCGGPANPRYSEALVNEGVTCVTCHVREGTVLTSLQSVSHRVPHALSYSPMLAKAELCAGCHQFDIRNPGAHRFESQPLLAASRMSGAILTDEARPQPAAADSTDSNTDEPPVPSQPFLHSQYQQEARVQHSLEEFSLSASAAKGGSCQSCHMPAVKGTPSHTWPGRNSVAMLQKAITLSARLDKNAYRPGDKLQAVILVKNEAGHRFPTGDSLHAGILDVWLMDGKKTLARQVFVMAEQSGAAQQILTNQIQMPGGGGFSGGMSGAAGGGMALNGTVQTLGGRQPASESLTLTRVLTEAGSPSTAQGLEGPSRLDTRLQPGEEAMFVFRQVVAGELAKAKAPVLRVRVFHAAVHPGFKGSPIDPKLSPMKLVREQTLPVKIGQPAPPGGATATTNPAPTRG